MLLSEATLLAWTALAVALVLTPGPDTILVAGHAARRSFRAGLAAAVGVGIGGIWYMALCGFGFLSLLAVVPEVFAVVKTLGAAYLVWLGIKLIRGALQPKPEGETPIAIGAPFRQGLTTTVLNPKVAIFFLAALPQFVGKGPEAPLQGALLVAIVYGLSVLWLTGVAAVAARVGRGTARSGALRWIEGALGLAFVGFAGKLALSRN